MEFPRLGQHCSAKACNKLDFLPMKCDACSTIFCNDHIKYDEHECPSSYRKNIQIPICPLCNQVVPYEYRDQSPDLAVSAHIDRDCKSRKREKVYANKCSISTCKQREAIPVNCEKCARTFCLRHRFPDDHKCQGLKNSSEDASRALATKASVNQKTQEENDYLLAKALQESEQEESRRNRANPTTATTTTTANNNTQPADKKTCSIQ